MRKILSFLTILLFTFITSFAQRKTDALDRGIVAVRTSSGVFVSWRIQADEYYDVKYNLYRNGVRIAQNLNVSNYMDNSGSSSNTYSVAPVVNGVEKAKCAAVATWSNRGTYGPQYLPIKVADVKDRNGKYVWQNNNGTVTSTQNYTINDIALGDVDGDGKIDFIVKRKNQTDQDELFPTSNTTSFCRIEVYTSKKDYQLAWYIDCGPNTVYGADEQWDAVAFDWDRDGKSEVLYRAYGNTIIHKADGSTTLIGSNSENIRPYITHSANMTFTNCGSEYLVYMDGETGAPYTTMDYPLKRVETSGYDIDWSNASVVSSKISGYLSAVNKEWGDSYGHRSSKYFMGAPYLDGRNPSIFLGRGIYTQTRMVAYDVDPNTHQLTQKWTWANKTSGSGWYAQGYHNYSIADVDEDGRDEIVYGSMVIDDNGRGLSTTGLGHGDASHTGDLDPFRKGLETFACNEDAHGNNFRNATTCEIYYRNSSDGDDGRAMAGNFSNDYPGCWGASTSSGIVSLTADRAVDGITNDWNGQTPSPMALNFRIYWDGDLLSESVNGPGSSEGYLFVDKLGSRIFNTGHGNYETACVNGTKKNPCAQGDIIGDWREELVMRSSDNTEFRIYTTTTPTTHRIPCLWYDHQYRQAMVWQTEGYNQPPHLSYFLGEMEDITKAPVPYTLTGRTELTNDGDVIPTNNGNAFFAYNKGKVGIPTEGASPSQLIINTPSTVSGNNGNGINYTYSTTSLGFDSYKGDLTGNMHLVKQGDGLLKLTARTFSYTGNTDVFAGSLYFRGTLNSPVWMNRHTTLYTGAIINSSVTMEYGSTMYIVKDQSTNSGGNPTVEYSSTTISSLNLHEGSRVVFDIDAGNSLSDVLNASVLSIRKRNWQYGPQYLAPVFQMNVVGTIASGRYQLGKVSSVEGNIGDIIIENNLTDVDMSLAHEGGMLYLDVVNNRGKCIGNLEHTASTTCGDLVTSQAFSVDAEKEHYNFEGSSKWQGYAFAKFSFSIPEGAVISSAELTWSAESARWYDTNLYYLNANKDVNYSAIASNESGLLRYNNEKTFITKQGSVQNGVFDIKTDVTEAVNNLSSQGYINFQWTANSGGADLYGKGSGSYAPKLVINYYIPERLLRGDCNGDKRVDIIDLVILIDAIKTNRGNLPKAADVNADGKVDMSDITELAAIVLGQ